MKKISEEDINDIFDIPGNMSHLNSNEDSHDVSYSDLVRDSGGDDFSKQVEKVHSTIVESNQDCVDKLNVESLEKIDCEDIKDNKNVNVEEDVRADGKDDKNDKNECTHHEAGKSSMSEDSLGWNLDCDEDMFANFYEEKSSAIKGWLLPFGEINFKSLISELKDARVDLSSLNYGDLHKIFSIMKEIQQWRDRVSQIAIRVNAQYYSWKRAIDLFIGLLAQFKYEKPATKQDGLVYKHMGDMIRYFSQLESSHKSVEMIMKNLDNAFECLSRQVTISMPGRDHEDLEKKASDRMSEKNVNNKDYVSKTDLSDSDKKILSDLDTVSSSKPVRNKKSVKTGKVDWNGNF